MRENLMRQNRIGGKLRRLRQERMLTQTQMAAALGISPSYLNLLESNQRPVTVNVLLKLAEKFQIDVSQLANEDQERLASDLMEALSDPLFDGQDLKASDARDLAANLPAVAGALLAVYRAYRMGAGEQTETHNALEADAPAGMPSEEVSEFLQSHFNHFHELEEASESLWLENGLALLTLQQDLVKLLAQRFGVDVEIAPGVAMPGLLRHYDPMNRRLMLSEMLPGPSRTFQIAHQIAFLAYRRELDAIVERGRFTSHSALALARSALANYFAGAVMTPYARFIAAARASRYDVDVLRHRFGVSFEQACHRLTTLRRPGQEGVPFHLMRVDIAGNISKRFSASGIHIARFGAACPRWNIYDAFSTPGMLRVQLSVMPDGERYFCIARTIEAPFTQPRGGLPPRMSKLAIGLGCHVRHARELVYSDGIAIDDPGVATLIGVSCRSCPRANCSDRAMPALAQKLEIDENRRGLSTYAATE